VAREVFMTKQSSPEHDRLVGLIAGTLRGRGERNVRADASGHAKPDAIRWRGERTGYVPDVTADGLVVEVETAASLEEEATAEIWKLCASYADRIDAAFIVVVPRGAEAKAQARLDALGLEAQVVGA
jgi:hypothetical protein